MSLNNAVEAWFRMASQRALSCVADAFCDRGNGTGLRRHHYPKGALNLGPLAKDLG